MDGSKKSGVLDPSISRRRKSSIAAEWVEAAAVVVVLPMVGWVTDGVFDAIVLGICGVLIAMATLLATADFVRGLDDA